MITIEMDWEETAITVLDPDGKEEDVQVLLYEDITYIRQWNEDIRRFSIICLTPKQMHLLMSSYRLPEGAYIYQTGDTNGS